MTLLMLLHVLLAHGLIIVGLPWREVEGGLFTEHDAPPGLQPCG